MTDIERYLRAATRDNTRRSYQAAIEHFESHWGGFLPATAETIARYLADHADQHAVSTLRQRLAALSQWHVAQGFPDPTKAPLVRQVLRGIRTLHPTPPKQAAPLLLQHLQTAVACFEEEARQAREHHDLAALRRARRDSALLLLGFWRGFRGDELARLRIEHIQAQAGVGITLFLPRSRATAKPWASSTAPLPSRPCALSLPTCNGLKSPVLPMGRCSANSTAGATLVTARSTATAWSACCGACWNVPGAGGAVYRPLLRRGFATWATANGWELKSLMSYVGWKDAKSALRYIDSAQRFGDLAVLPASQVQPLIP